MVGHKKSVDRGTDTIPDCDFNSISAKPGERLSHESIQTLLEELEAPIASLEKQIQRVSELTESSCCQEEEFAHSLEMAKQSISDVLTLLNQSMPTRQEEGWRTMPLTDLIRSVVEILKPDFVRAGVGLEVGPLPEALLVKCRPDEVAIAMHSLIRNALESASISARIESEFDPRIELGVRDLGDEVEILISSGGIGHSNNCLDPSHQSFDQVQGALFRTDLTFGAAQRIAKTHQGCLIPERSGELSLVRFRLPLAGTCGFLN